MTPSAAPIPSASWPCHRKEQHSEHFNQRAAFALSCSLFGMWCKCLSSTGLDAMHIPRCGHRPTVGAAAGAGSGLATIGLKFNFWFDFNVRGDAGRGESRRVDCEIRLPSQFRKAFPLSFSLSLSLSLSPACPCIPRRTGKLLLSL